jgi:DNA-binding transcriptional LysR family regulator
LLHLSQPALSQQISILEDELGTSLFSRDRRRVELTPAGEVLLEYARRIVDLSQTALETVRQAAGDTRSSIRVAYTSSALLPISNEVIKEFQIRHPEVRLELRSGWTSRNLEDLLHGRVDVAFVRPLIKHAQIKGTEICRERLAVAVPADHTLATREQVSIADLRKYPVILRPGQYELFRGELWTEGPPQSAGEEPDEENALIAVARGVGIFVLPEAWAKTLHVDGVVIRTFSGPQPELPLLVAFNEENVTPTIRHFIEVARQVRDWTAAS